MQVMIKYISTTDYLLESTCFKITAMAEILANKNLFKSGIHTVTEFKFGVFSQMHSPSAN